MAAGTSPGESGLALTGLRVVDLADGRVDMCGRFLADLGADVVRVEPPGGSTVRHWQPRHDGVGLHFATHNWNKRSAVMDLTSQQGLRELFSLTDRADLVIESFRPGQLADLGAGQAVLRQRNRQLVVASISDYGQTGPYRDRRASNATHLAMSGELSRSGEAGREPLMPPGELAYESAAIQAAFAALLAVFDARRTGVGDYVDCAVLELAAQSIDPQFGIGGTAGDGLPPADMPPGRPDFSARYPIFRCADGHVRICILATHQWRGMFEWLGSPQAFADPTFDSVTRRFRSVELRRAIAAHFAPRAKADLVAEGQRYGVPIGALALPGDVLAIEHFHSRGGFAEVELAPGLRGVAPTGFVEIDGAHAGYRHRAPLPGEHTEQVLAEARADGPAASEGQRLADRQAGERPVEQSGVGPLTGLRVLDLGVIVVGADTGRLLADQGAEVIKIENRAHPDGTRSSATKAAIAPNFAYGARNKLGFGLDLRSPDGARVFRRLVAESDVVLSNFKPGTMESLGFGYDQLREINPAIIAVDSSALGRTGPWSRRMGYGPLVRAEIGITSLWRHPSDPDAFGDHVTIYPDHTAARVAVAALVATLIERLRTGRGRQLSVAQAEVAFSQLITGYVREGLQPGTLTARGAVGEFDAPHDIYPCAGEDEWCAITVDGDADWRRLCAAIGRADLAADAELATAAGRVARRELIEDAVTAWTRQRPPALVERLLQDAGVAAGAMRRIADLAADPHLRARGFLRELNQPELNTTYPTENGPAVFERIPDPALRPAPYPGEHTREICRRVLGMPDTEIDALIHAGVLEQHTPAEPAEEIGA